MSSCFAVLSSDLLVDEGEGWVLMWLTQVCMLVLKPLGDACQPREENRRG